MGQWNSSNSNQELENVTAAYAWKKIDKNLMLSFFVLVLVQVLVQVQMPLSQIIY